MPTKWLAGSIRRPVISPPRSYDLSPSMNSAPLLPLFCSRFMVYCNKRAPSVVIETAGGKRGRGRDFLKAPLAPHPTPHLSSPAPQIEPAASPPSKPRESPTPPILPGSLVVGGGVFGPAPPLLLGIAHLLRTFRWFNIHAFHVVLPVAERPDRQLCLKGRAWV